MSFCHDIPRPGDACPVDVGGGVPLALVRDDNGDVRVFHNVCRHRGAVVVAEPCSGQKVLTCPYHGWSYGIDGRLRMRPHFRGAGRHDVTHDGNAAPGLVPVRAAV